MSEKWLLDLHTQNRIAEFINKATRRVINGLDPHNTENGLTAALGQELIRDSLYIQETDTTVIFKYRKFGEIREEPDTGADGGFLVTIQTKTKQVKKAILFQAKKLTEAKPVRSLSLSKDKVDKLKDQIETMLEITLESVVVVYTQKEIYALDALILGDVSLAKLKRPLDATHPTKLGTYLGKWVARCARGDEDKEIIDRLNRPKGFINYLIEMDIKADKVDQRLLPAASDPDEIIADLTTNRRRKAAQRRQA